MFLICPIDPHEGCELGLLPTGLNSCHHDFSSFCNRTTEASFALGELLIAEPCSSPRPHLSIRCRAKRIPLLETLSENIGMFVIRTRNSRTPPAGAHCSETTAKLHPHPFPQFPPKHILRPTSICLITSRS